MALKLIVKEKAIKLLDKGMMINKPFREGQNAEIVDCTKNAVVGFVTSLDYEELKNLSDYKESIIVLPGCVPHPMIHHKNNQMAKSKNYPTKKGYYWARWIECEPDTEDHDVFEARDHFEPVEVTQNDPNDKLPPIEKFRVFVLGFGGSQHLTFFEWGAEIKQAGE